MEIKKISENVYEIAKTGKMLVPVRIFASEKILEKIKEDKTLQQAKNMAMIEGSVQHVVVLPDAHQGYGACIGGVSAFDTEKGVISPGQVGYDINCSVRLLKTNLTLENVKSNEKEISNELFNAVPSGVGKGGLKKLSEEELDGILEEGAQWLVKNGFGKKEDYLFTENQGKLEGAKIEYVSPRAKARGRKQLGTLGAGNHFLEIQQVEKIFDEKAAKVLGLKEGDITVMIHCGSRGLGHQTATDYIKEMERKYGWSHLPDRQLICAPIKSELGQKYFGAMAAAANFGFANKQLITHKIREFLKKILPDFEAKVVYDICHNIAKFETHKINGEERELLIVRKGATRSFGPGRKEVPKKYREIGQPIFIPGSMGTASYVLLGTKKAEEVSLASTAHGAGRLLSRSYAKKNLSLDNVKKDLEKKGIAIKTDSVKGILEEAPQAYKDVDEVVKVSHDAGIGKMVAKLKPLIVIKG